MRRGQSKGEAAALVARWERCGDDVVLLMERVAVQIQFGVSERTVRRRCEPVACDVTTRVPLYEQEDAARQLAGVTPRPGATVAARRTTAAAAYRAAT